MSCFKLIIFSFIMFTIIGMVKGRWLEVEPYSTSSMISDGINHESPPSHSFFSTTLLGDEKQCQSVYGFLPCADTIPEGMFLMIMYTYLMMLGEDWIQKGNQALFLLLGDVAFGASVFRLLRALPTQILVFVTNLVLTESAAQNQVAFGMYMYAGSTLITLTFIWGFQIILYRDKLRGKGALQEYDEYHSSMNGCWSQTKHKLSLVNDNGVNIDKGTWDIVVIMLLSLIPFAAVELVALVNSPTTVLFALVVSGVSLVLYFAYQIGNPWIQARSLAYLKQENLRTRLFFHVQSLAEDNLIDEHGMPKNDAFKRCFNRADKDGDDNISHDELEHLFKDTFKLEQNNISMEYAKAEILTNFDYDNNGCISCPEFIEGCSIWLEKWKEDAKKSNSIHRNLLKQAEKLVIKNKRANLTTIKIIMPRVLRQVLEKQGLVKDNKPDKEKLEELFSYYDEDSDGEIHQQELKRLIETLGFGVSLDHDTVLEKLIEDFDEDASNTITKHEFVEGFLKWIEKAIKHDPNIKDLKHAIKKFEEVTLVAKE